VHHGVGDGLAHGPERVLGNVCAPGKVGLAQNRSRAHVAGHKSHALLDQFIHRAPETAPVNGGDVYLQAQKTGRRDQGLGQVIRGVAAKEEHGGQGGHQVLASTYQERQVGLFQQFARAAAGVHRCAGSAPLKVAPPLALVQVRIVSFFQRGAFVEHLAAFLEQAAFLFTICSFHIASFYHALSFPPDFYPPPNAGVYSPLYTNPRTRANLQSPISNT
jgi:hypothetical protein